MTPGYKTTEFWLTLLTTIVGALMTSGLVGDGTQLARVLGMVAVVLGALGYTIVRGGVKKATTPMVTTMTTTDDGTVTSRTTSGAPK